MPEIDDKTIQFILKKYVPKRYLNQREACIYAGTSPKTIADQTIQWMLGDIEAHTDKYFKIIQE